MYSLRAVTHPWERFAFSVLGVSVAVMLVVLLGGFARGLRAQLTVYLTNAPGSLVVAQRGTRGFMVGTSLLPLDAEARVRRVPQVARVVPILTRPYFFEVHDQKVFAVLIGFDPQVGGGPWSLARGRLPRAAGDVVIDEALARTHDLRVGTLLNVSGRAYRVVGLSRGTGSWMTSLAFLRKTELEQSLLLADATSFLFVTPDAGRERAVLDALQRVPNVEVLTRSQLIAQDVRTFQAFLTPITWMVGVAYLIGTLVVGFVVGSVTHERHREFAVLKALGATFTRLSLLVVQHACTVALPGALLGGLFAWTLARLVTWWRPQINVIVDARSVILAVSASLLMAAVAVIVPLRRVAKLAPADVYRR